MRPVMETPLGSRVTGASKAARDIMGTVTDPERV